MDEKMATGIFSGSGKIEALMGDIRTDRTFRSEAADGVVFVEKICPEKPNGETVLILHGLGDHFGRHEWAVRFFTKQGYSVIGLDWPGNGRSEGKRGDLPPTALIDEFLEEVLSREEAFPTGILAHSTGVLFSDSVVGRKDSFLSECGVDLVIFATSSAGS